MNEPTPLPRKPEPSDAERRRKLLDQLRRNTIAVSKLVAELQAMDAKEDRQAA